MIKQSGGQRAMHPRGRVPGSSKHARGAMMKRPILAILATPFAFWRREREGVLVRCGRKPQVPHMGAWRACGGELADPIKKAARYGNISPSFLHVQELVPAELAVL